MQISPSQLASYLTCPRQWWFRSVHKLRDGKDPTSRDRGTVLHAVCQRFCEADDNGRDKNGQPVDLFPEGWERVLEFGKDTGRRVNHYDQAWVREMVQKGIDNGVLRRLPQRQVEYDYTRDVVPGVKIKGVIDQVSPTVIEDHKTTKRRKYALGKKKLRADDKMLCYAVEAVEKRGKDDQTPVRLRLNYYCYDTKKDPQPWATEVDVPADEIARFRQTRLEPAAREMLAIKERNVPMDSWQEIEGPRVGGACDDYGGCAYARICGGMSAASRHKEIQDARANNQPIPTKSGQKMNYFGKKPGPKKTSPAPQVRTEATPGDMANAGVPDVVTPQEATSQVDEAPSDPQVHETAVVTPETPPWAVKGCNACKSSPVPGINSKGDPCRACDVVASRTKGMRTSSTYKIWRGEDGKLKWTEPDGSAQVVKQLEAPATPTPAAPAEQPAVAEPAKKPKKEKAKAPAVPGAIMQEAAQMAATASKQFPGFVLYIGCAPFNTVTIDLHTALFRAQEAIATEANTFWNDLDPLRRRDVLAGRAQDLAKELDGCHVVANGTSQDFRALLDAIRPFATTTIMAVGI